LTITPPIVVRGVTIELCRSYDAARVLHDVHAAPEHIVAWVDYTADDDIELVENDDEIVQGGETLFF
ncbi:MAG: hypothetical protein KAI24_04225, partial [Planctomycetes bacterium]|nr:hypothetical protein [Planctomycetota bacterium]